VAGAGQFQPAADHRTVQRRDHRHRAVLHAFQRDVPGPRVQHALAGIALGQFRKVETGAEVFAFAVDHRRAHGGRHVFKGLADGLDEAVVEGVALGGAGQADDGHCLLLATDLDRKVFAFHAVLLLWSGIMIMKNN
jgi:hypothetical protein